MEKEWYSVHASRFKTICLIGKSLLVAQVESEDGEENRKHSESWRLTDNHQSSTSAEREPK